VAVGEGQTYRHVRSISSRGSTPVKVRIAMRHRFFLFFLWEGAKLLVDPPWHREQSHAAEDDDLKGTVRQTGAGIAAQAATHDQDAPARKEGRRHPGFYDETAAGERPIVRYRTVATQAEAGRDLRPPRAGPHSANGFLSRRYCRHS